MLRVCIAFLLLVVPLSMAFAEAGSSRIPVDPPPEFISHGGAILIQESDSAKPRWHLSNSLNSLDANYAAGHVLFEIDLDWTSDKHLVGLHDWGHSFRGAFKQKEGEKKERALSLYEFMKRPMNYGLSQLNIELVNKWLTRNPGSYLVTDIKSRNADGLRYISNTNRVLAAERYIPQIKHFSEYKVATELGFKRIILTLYQLHDFERSDDAILEFVRNNPLYAVTMPEKRALEGNLAKLLSEMDVFVYAHTVNSPTRFEALRAQGVSGVYTDSIVP